MNLDDAKREARLARLLAATRAPADPMILARARARILAERAGEAPAWLAWFANPAAVAAAAVLCVMCGAACIQVWQGAAMNGTAHTESATMVSALLDDDGSDGVPAVSSVAATRDPADSGSTP